MIANFFSMVGLLYTLIVAEWQIKLGVESRRALIAKIENKTEPIAFHHKLSADPNDTYLPQDEFQGIETFQEMSIPDIVKITTAHNWILTLSCGIAIVFNILYHKVEISIFKFDNSVSPELTYISVKTCVKIILELALLLVHPNRLYKAESFFNFPSLYFLMLLRIIPFCRVLIFESLIFGNTKTETVATLNSMNFGCLSNESIRLIIRHYMDASSGKILSIVTMMNWLLMAECIRLAEAREAILEEKMNVYNFHFADMFWLVAITYMTIGYGDYSAKTIYGRFFCVWIGISGTVASALLVTLMTAKLTMTRRERLLHKVLNSDNIKKELKDKAAIVLQRTYRRHLKGYNVLCKSGTGGTSGSVNVKLKAKLGNTGSSQSMTMQIQSSIQNPIGPIGPTNLAYTEKGAVGTHQNNHVGLGVSFSDHVLAKSSREETFIDNLDSGESGSGDQETDSINKTSKDDLAAAANLAALAVPQIQTTKVLDAITSFRKLRIQNKYMDDDMTDMVDLGGLGWGNARYPDAQTTMHRKSFRAPNKTSDLTPSPRIVQSHTANEIKDLSSRIDTLEDKIDLILKKIS